VEGVNVCGWGANQAGLLCPGWCLLRLPTDVDGGMPSTTLPEVDDYLHHFVDIEGEMIVVAPDSLSLSRAVSRRCFVTRPTTVASSANLRIESEEEEPPQISPSSMMEQPSSSVPKTICSQERRVGDPSRPPPEVPGISRCQSPANSIHSA